MNMDRKRPPKDCPDLAFWLSETINDAIRDAKEAGLSGRMAAHVALSHALHTARVACMTEATIQEIVTRGAH